MKLRQFIILCLLVVIWFGYLGYKIEKSDNENKYQTITLEWINSDISDIKSDIWMIKNDVVLLREWK